MTGPVLQKLKSCVRGEKANRELTGEEKGQHNHGYVC